MPSDEDEVSKPTYRWDFFCLVVLGLDLASDITNLATKHIEAVKYQAIAHANWRVEQRKFVGSVARDLENL